MATPPEKHEVVEKGEYRLTFYPGFLRSATVEDEGGRTEIYSQSGFHDMRGKSGEPLTRHVIRVEGGRNKRDMALTIDDPGRAIAEIVVRLHPAGYTPGEGNAPAPAETFSFKEDAILCPPIC